MSFLNTISQIMRFGQQHQYNNCQPRVYQHSAKVYVWETTISRDNGDEDGGDSTPGHVSIELQKSINPLIVGHSKPVENHYVSLRPKWSILVNPFLFFLPCPGVNLSSVQEDCDHESSTETPKKPNRTINIQLNEQQYTAMSKKAAEVRENIEKGKVLYHLFPGASILSTVRALARQSAYGAMTECPFSGTSIEGGRHKDMAGINEIQGSHCALAVREVLNAGGIDVKISNWVPWKVTPTELADNIDYLNDVD